jgi:hypothetical protein
MAKSYIRGSLVLDSEGVFGCSGLNQYTHYRCIDCNTIYPEIDGFIQCNNTYIELCPFCREDAKSWRNGAGYIEGDKSDSSLIVFDAVADILDNEYDDLDIDTIRILLPEYTGFVIQKAMDYIQSLGEFTILNPVE